MVRITDKSQLQAPFNMQMMLMATISVIVVIATVLVGAAIVFNQISLSLFNIFFQMMILSALLLNAIFLIRIEQKGSKSR